MSNARETKGPDVTWIALLAAGVMYYFYGLEAAAWTLVGIWTVLFALMALMTGLTGTLGAPSGVKMELRLGPQGRLGALFLALWGLGTALAFALLALEGHPLFWLPVLSLSVVAFPGTGRLMLDEYVQQLLARGAALAGGLALAAGPLLGLLQPPGLDLAIALLAIYAVALEAYVVRALRA